MASASCVDLSFLDGVSHVIVPSMSNADKLAVLSLTDIAVRQDIEKKIYNPDFTIQDVDTGCILSTRACVQRKKVTHPEYTQVFAYMNSARVHMLSHRVVAIWNMNRAPLPNEQASHLCGNSRCVAKNHLILESPLANQSRIHCVMGANCVNCGGTVYVCPHTPICKKYIDPMHPICCCFMFQI